MRPTFYSQRQSGFSLLEVLLAISVAIALGGMQLSTLRNDTERLQGEAVGRQLNRVGLALDRYIGLSRSQLINGTSIVGVGSVDDPGPRTCVSISTTQGPGWQCEITTDTLRRIGVLPADFSGTNAMGAAYEYIIRVQGTAPDWKVDGIVRTNKPYSMGGKVREDLIGIALIKAGADAGIVTNNLGAIMGFNGSWADDNWNFGIPERGMIAYRAGYGAMGFNSLLRSDGSTPMTDDMSIGGHDIQNVVNYSINRDAGFGRLTVNDPRSDALVLGQSGAPNNAVIGNNGNRLAIRANGGTQMVNAAGSGTDLTAGNINVGSVTANGVGIFAGAVQSDAGMTSAGGQPISSSGAISAIGDFVTEGSYQTTAGSFNTTNGSLAAQGGAISSRDLVIGGNASIGNTLRFGAGSAGWYYDSITNTMTVGNNANLRVGSAPGCDLSNLTGTSADDCRVTAGQIYTAGTVEGQTLTISGQQAAGAPCNSYTFATDMQGRMLQCESGVFTLMGGAKQVTTRNSVVAFSGQQAMINCPAGYKMVGGGWMVTQRNTPTSDPYAPSKSYGIAASNSWVIENIGNGNTAGFQAQVVCAN